MHRYNIGDKKGEMLGFFHNNRPDSSICNHILYEGKYKVGRSISLSHDVFYNLINAI